jgi:hypothetical protein
MLALLLAAALVAPPAAPLTRDELRARYAGIRSLSADVLQVKEGRFWARPLESQIRLRYTPDRIVWESLSPVRTSVVIEGDHLTVSGAGGQARELSALASDPRVAALLSFIRSLITVDLAAIERDFDVTYGVGELVATPRALSEVKLFERVRIGFDARHELAELELETASERTRLTFLRIVRDPPPPALPAPAAR